jgi:hypothetical protein
MARSLVLFALTIRTHCSRAAMQNQDHNASGSKNKDFRAGGFFDRPAKATLFLPLRANIAEREQCVARLRPRRSVSAFSENGHWAILALSLL